jgi:hypothetical protein
MINGNVLPVRPVRPFPLIAGLPANLYQIENLISICRQTCKKTTQATQRVQQ